jgi:hypothetical protein
LQRSVSLAYRADAGSSDAARAEAEHREHATQRIKAVRVVAGAAEDSGDARMLLEMLGLANEEILAAAHQNSAAA